MLKPFYMLEGQIKVIKEIEGNSNLTGSWKTFIETTYEDEHGNQSVIYREQ